MLVNIHHDSKREHTRLLVAGVVFLTVIALLIGLSIPVYQKKFHRATMVTIHADRAGLQLARFGDVRLNGVLVGQVRSVDEDGQQAVIKVAIEPDEAKDIPENVDVQIIPTTLFGQKFIQLVKPQSPTSQSLHDGQVIPAGRVETNVELSHILADLFPLLRAVQPAELNYTLNALATALQGRGEAIGNNLEVLNGYLQRMNPQMPKLIADVKRLGTVSDIYADVFPDIAATLRNSVTTGT